MDLTDDQWNILRPLIPRPRRRPDGRVAAGALCVRVRRHAEDRADVERAGDHATNIAEAVVFLVDATDIRHSGKRARRTER